MKTIKTVLTLLMGIALLSLTACRETAEGMGQDIENAGDEIQKVIE